LDGLVVVRKFDAQDMCMPLTDAAAIRLACHYALKKSNIVQYYMVKLALSAAGVRQIPNTAAMHIFFLLLVPDYYLLQAIVTIIFCSLMYFITVDFRDPGHNLRHPDQWRDDRNHIELQHSDGDLPPVVACAENLNLGCMYAQILSWHLPAPD